ELLGLRQKGTTIILSTHRMESVEELCTHIALINKSKKILDGQVKDVRKQFRSNLFEIEYKGTSVGFANALWTGFELVETRTQDDHAFAIVKNLNNSSANDLLRQLLNDVEVISFRERIPTMNDIFIESVQNNKPLEA
ncbi:MAG TPA: DUF4162 domain-containing protein, partial [Bacteroidia bacterium]|nr:DUF4162 domain-containing protein [Bacteroidia bacterium]